VCWRVCVSVCKEISRAFPVEEERGERERDNAGVGESADQLSEITSAAVEHYQIAFLLP
jgi:hypothetical protein